MPYVQFEINRTISEPEKQAVIEGIYDVFQRVTGTGNGNIGVSIRETDKNSLFFGDPSKNREGIAFIRSDIGSDVTPEQKLKLAKGFTELIHGLFFIPFENMYVSLSEFGSYSYLG